jgi:uncharacterized phage-like protein YoqJ
MELGVDTWCAEIVLSLQKDFNNLRLICVIPYTGQEKKWSSENQMRYRHLIENCSNMVFISKGYTDTCYVESARYVVDHSDILFAVHGDDDSIEGSTDPAVLYAQSKGKRILSIPSDPFITTKSED